MKPSLDPTLEFSILVPVRNGEDTLERCLAAIGVANASRPDVEVIVADDASVDRSAEIAEHAGWALRLRRRAGSAAARNRAAARARGRWLVFVDADVAVPPDLLRRLAQVERLERNPSGPACGGTGSETCGGILGSYDADPPAPGMVSRYRNLLHHWVHQTSAGACSHFFSGLGAVRRDAFFAAGGFAEHLRGVEDIELGYRLRDLGWRLVLDPQLQGAHLKRWTLRSMVSTDLATRARPWARLLGKRLLERRHLPPRDFNLAPRHLLAHAAGLTAAASLVVAPRLPALAMATTAASLAVLALALAPLLRLCARHGGAGLVLAALPLHLVHLFCAWCGAALGAWDLVVGALPARRRARLVVDPAAHALRHRAGG